MSVAFFLLDTLKDQLLGIPWSLWDVFVVEQRHGFNKQTPRLFFTDQLKQVLPGHERRAPAVLCEDAHIQAASTCMLAGNMHPLL